MKTAEEILSEKFGVIKGDNPGIIEAMEEYANQFKTKWISVEERLPDHMFAVLVCVDGYYQMNPAWYSQVSNKWMWVYNTSSSKEIVSHWMEFPHSPNT